MSINTSIGLAGIARQADEHSPALKPQFAHGLRGGSVINLERSTSTTAVTCRSRSDSGVYVETIETNPSYQLLGYADILPLYYVGALGEIITTTTLPVGFGYEGPQLYKHVITGGKSIPSLTMFGQVGEDALSGGFGVTENCKVDTLSASFEGNAPIEFSVGFRGCGLYFTDDDPFDGCEASCFDGSFVPTDGIFRIDTASDKPAEAIITQGSIEVNNNCSVNYELGQVMPARVNTGQCTIVPSFTVVPDNIEPYRAMVTGSKTGRRPTSDIVYGSFYCKFRHSVNPEFYIEYSADRVPFTADFVEVDPEGDAGEFTFTADTTVISKATGTPITVTIVNDTPGNAYRPSARSTYDAKVDVDRVGRVA